MRPLDPYEKNLLRGIEEHLVQEDPGLAERLGTLRPGLRHRLSPRRWPVSVYWTLSAVLMSIGLVLGDGVSFLGGLLLGVAACVRRWGPS